ncbi:MAG: hypothetical protein WA919_28395 [Coleofasciculaceae cyanobacterium]
MGIRLVLIISKIDDFLAQETSSMPENIISAEIESLPNQASPAALALQNMGFRILHIGSTISVEAPRVLWESIFNVSFKKQQKTIMPEVQSSEVSYEKACTEGLKIPTHLQNLVSKVMFVEPPELF